MQLANSCKPAVQTNYYLYEASHPDILILNSKLQKRRFDFCWKRGLMKSLSKEHENIFATEAYLTRCIPINDAKCNKCYPGFLPTLSWPGDESGLGGEFWNQQWLTLNVWSKKRNDLLARLRPRVRLSWASELTRHNRSFTFILLWYQSCTNASFIFLFFCKAAVKRVIQQVYL